MEKKNWVAFKERYEYAVTKNVFWSDKLQGPFSDEELSEVLSNLREVKRLGDVKGIKVLVEKN